MWWPSYLYIIHIYGGGPNNSHHLFFFSFFSWNHFLSRVLGEVIISSFLFINFVLRSIALCSKIRKKCNLMKLHNYLKGYNWVSFLKEFLWLEDSQRIFFLQKMCKISSCTHCVIALYSHLFEQECIVVVCVCVYICDNSF